MMAANSVQPTSPRRKLAPSSMGILSAAGAISGLCLLGIWLRPFQTTEQIRKDAIEAIRAGKYDQAEMAFARLPALKASDWLLRTEVAVARNDFNGAWAHVNHVPDEGALSVRKAILMGQIAFARFHARDAEKAFLRALELDPKQVAARRSLVYLYGTQERRSELMEQFSALADQGPLTLELVQHWCLSRGAIGDPAKVRSDLEQFVANDPEDRWSRLALAGTYRQLGELDRSESVLADLPQDDPDARASRAQLSILRGDSQVAEALLAEGPQDHAVLARLRGRLALTRRDGPASVRFYRLSDKAEPNNRDTLDGLVQALRISGDEAGAEPVILRARAHDTLRNLLQRTTTDQDLSISRLFEIANACEAIDRVSEACAWYRLVLVADPLNTRAQQALFRLASTSSQTK